MSAPVACTCLIDDEIIDMRDCPVHDAYCYGGTYDKREAADAVLAMPEMQSIRKALLSLAYSVEHGFGTPVRVLLAEELPPAVVVWVLEGEQ